MNSTPTVSIIIPTYNEQAAIDGLLTHLQGAGADDIIVVDGCSADRTFELASDHPGVRVLRTYACRASQMNEGARVASGEVLLFLHSDVRLAAGAVDAVRDVMRNPVVLGGNFEICYQGGNFAAACFSSVNRWRQRWGIFYGDSGIFCRRSVFESMGGFRPWPIMEDYEFARRLWKTGRIAFLRKPIMVSDRRWRKRGLSLTVASWFAIQGLYAVGVSPLRLARFYRVVR